MREPVDETIYIAADAMNQGNSAGTLESALSGTAQTVKK